MRSSHAARFFDPLSRFIAVLCVAALCCGLMPSAAFAASNSLSLIPEGAEGAASIDLSAEGGDAGAFSHFASDDPLAADGDGAASTSEDAIDRPDVDAMIAGQGSDGPSDAAPVSDIISQTMPLETVAQGESTRSYFLAQTLESTRTVPVVSASLPLDTSKGSVVDKTEADTEGSEQAGSFSIVAADSTVVGSFERFGMTFAIEAGGSSVALMAVDYVKLPERFIQDQIISIPETVTDNGIDSYSVERIADGAFSTLTEANADPDHVGCGTSFFNEELLLEAGVDPSEAADAADMLEGRIGILALGIPASVTEIEDEAFAGSDTLLYLIVPEDDPAYASYDGALYDVDLTRLLFVPEGRAGMLAIAPSAMDVEPGTFADSTSISSLSVDSESEVRERLRANDLRNGYGETIALVAASEAEAADAYARSACALSILGATTSIVGDDVFAAGDSSSFDLTSSEVFAAANSRQAHFSANGGSLLIKWAPQGTENFQLYAKDQADWPLYWENEPECYMVSSGAAYWVSWYRGTELIDVQLRWYLEATRSGYKLAGWKTQTGELWPVNSFTTRTIPGGTHFFAQWAGNPYAVGFNANGGTGGQSATVTATYGSAMPAITATPPTKLGYRFDGWWDTAAATGGTQYYTATGASAHVWDKANAATLHARWVKQSAYEAHLWANGGSILVKKSPYSADDYTLYANGVADWPIFFYPSGYAYWTYHGQLYWLSDYVEYAPGSNFEKWFIEAYRPGYHLRGWKDESGTLWGSGPLETENLTGGHFLAEWEPLAYTVSFDANGGSGGQTAAVTATFDAAMPAISPVAPTRPGYTFAGWWDTSDPAGGTQYYTSTGASARTWNKDINATLYARWTLNAQYTVTFDVNGGTGGQTASVTATYGMDMPAISTVAPTKTGCSFAGWWDTAAPTGGTQYYTNAGASARAWDKAADATLYARWTANSYAIIWDAQGGNVTVGADVASQIFGNVLKAPEKPSKRGYAFDGWWTTAGNDPLDPGTRVDDGTVTVPPSNATYFAHWRKVQGEVFLNAGSSAASFAQDRVDAYNAIAGRPQALFVNDQLVKLVYDATTEAFSLTEADLLPSLVGSSFDGWEPSIISFAPGSTPTWDEVSEAYEQSSYTAKWSANSYSITYRYVNQDGSALAGCQTADGSALPLTFNEATAVRTLPAMKLRGYTWLGWTYEGNAVTAIPNVSENVMLVANFTADPYAMEVDLDGGTDVGWLAADLVATYDDPHVTLPVNNDVLRKPGYVFRCFEAYTAEGTGPVYVYEQGSTAPTKTLEPGKTYRVLDLTDDDGSVYDAVLLRAIWDVRIAVDVPSTVSLGIMADMSTDSLRFRHDETVYTGDNANVYAPLTFASYTTAPIGIVKIADDATDAQAPARTALLQQAFKGNHGSIALAVSADKSLARHRLHFGGATMLQEGSGHLEGLRIAAADAASSLPSRATFYLGMDFGVLKAADLEPGLEGDIAKLSYTVALLDESDDPIAGTEGSLSAYDEGGIRW